MNYLRGNLLFNTGGLQVGNNHKSGRLGLTRPSTRVTAVENSHTGVVGGGGWGSNKLNKGRQQGFQLRKGSVCGRAAPPW